MKRFFEAAIRNIYRHGDTDIFPFPIENRIMHDSIEETSQKLCEIYDSFDAYFSANSPDDIRSQVPVNHTGFRWATQLDPLWNAYFLGIVLSLAESIERKRLSTEHVFSYRIDTANFLDGSIFRNDISWSDFIIRSRKMCEEYDFVVVCDIADCYSRVSHHKLENAIRSLNPDNRVKDSILKYLGYLTGTKSSGLPIGGPASRILAELALVNTDQILNDRSIPFVRYADDYHIFCKSRREAYEALVLASEALDNEGLALQKSKTRILTRSEYISSSQSLLLRDGDIKSPVQRLMSLSLRFDPYALNAAQNYEELKAAVSKIDIVALLNEQLSRSRIHIPATKKIISALRVLDRESRFGAAMSMLNSMDLLYPISSVVFVAIRSMISDLHEDHVNAICDRIIDLYMTGHEVMSTPIGVAYAVRIIGQHQSPANQRFLNRCFNDQNDSLVRRDIILIFSNWGNFAWLSMFKAKFTTASAWERRAMILASYSMLDEGSHWRNHVKSRFSDFELIARDWRAVRVQQNPQLPL